MNKIILLSFVLLSFTASAQFRTSHSQTGDPLTERTDASEMKQGKWTYFDLHDNVIREEFYADNLLIARQYNTGNSTVEQSELLSLEEIRITLPENLKGAFRGEVLVDRKGNLQKISAYSAPEGNIDNRELLKKYITSIAQKHKGSILIF